MTTGQLIQRERKKAGLSQRELGEKLGVSGSMIGQYENDLRNPKSETLLRISAALNVPIYALSPSNVLKNHLDELQKECDKITLQIVEAEENGLPESEIVQLEENRRELSRKWTDIVLYNPDFFKHLDPEVELLYHFKNLNAHGKEKAIERIAELAEISKYRRKDPLQEAPEGEE